GGAVQLVPAREQGLAPNPAVELRIHGGKSPGRLILFSRNSMLAVQDYSNQVFGAYWYDYGELTAEQRMAGTAGARIDVLHGENNTLYYRNWNGKQVLALDELPVSEENAKKEQKESNKVNAFKMPIAQLEMYVDKFIPGSTPGKIEEALPFNKQKAP